GSRIEPESRQRARPGYEDRAAERGEGGCQGRRTRARCARQGREDRHRRQARRWSRSLLCPDGADRNSRGCAGDARRDVRAGRTADAVRYRRRSAASGERDRIRPCELLLYSRRRPRVARRGGPGKRHGRHQRRHHLDRGGAVRRREGKRHRARRLEVRPRGISRDQVSLLRRRMKATVRWVDNVMFVGESGSGHAVVMDGAPEAGGRNLGVRPMEMLLLGLGGCTAFDVVMILEKGREPVTDCIVDMDADRAETEPKVFTRIQMRYRISGRGLDPKKVERAVNLSAEKYCSATAMLAKTAQIS